MATFAVLILAIFRVAVCSADSIPGGDLVSVGNFKLSQAMVQAKGWNSIPSQCGFHDFYTQVSSQAQEVVADCSLTGDIRGNKGKLQSCLDECCSIKSCIGISARNTGTKLVQSFMYAQPDPLADSYMLHEISQMVLIAHADDEPEQESEEGSFVEADDKSSTLEVSPVMMSVRGFPPMASNCGRHDPYGQIGAQAAEVIGECTKTGDIREKFHSLQRCLNECCATDSCVGISATVNGTKLIKSFESAGVDPDSTSFVLFQPTQLNAKAEVSSEAVSEDEQGLAVADAMKKMKSYPPMAMCGKRYDAYGGVGGKPAAELGDCSVTGDIRDSHVKLQMCLQSCCNTEKCVGITATSSGTKLISSFADVDEDEGLTSYMVH